MERFINILIVNGNDKIQKGLKQILVGGGNNVLLSDSIENAYEIVKNKEIGIIIVSVDDSKNALHELNELRRKSKLKNNYILIITSEISAKLKLVKGLTYGAVDYISFPFNPNLVKSKVEVYKSLYYKDQRIGQLLNNIFPSSVINDLAGNGKFSAKQIQNGVVIFTDFVDFSAKAKKINPLQLIKKLENYFTKFDEIIEKYNIEKIKTIGDSYMAIAGVTESYPKPTLRACLAAMEIRNFMRNERDVAIAMKKDFWEIRIGIHMGPLVAGIIGTSKYSFDVWGDTVNIAARAEAASVGGKITITSNIQPAIENYFETKSRGQIDIHKRGGNIEMFYLGQLKTKYCMYGEGVSPNSKIREICGLETVDFQRMRTEIINRLKSLLPDNISYHDVHHTIDVEKSVIRYSKLEGITNHEILLLRTAALFHDAGYILKYSKNEDFAIQMANKSLPKFGFIQKDIEIITSIINATKHHIEPINNLQKIMCDADHDYLGRPDYYMIANKLREELNNLGKTFKESEWLNFQINFLKNEHIYYTETARNIRELGKTARIEELEQKLKEIE
jgi:class 3 adenylate cyclase/predicted metal-dependent HD superfamily phosphohydrolase